MSSSSRSNSARAPRRFLSPDLIAAFRASGLTQRAATQLLDLPPGTVSIWLHGAHVPDGPKSTERVYRLADLLGFPRHQAFTTSRRLGVSLDALMSAVEVIAAQRADGHVSIFRFTTGWAAMWHTPIGREDIASLPTFPTLRQALQHLISDSKDVGR